MSSGTPQSGGEGGTGVQQQEQRVVLPALDCTDDSATLLLTFLPLARRSQQGEAAAMGSASSAVGLDVIAP